MCLAIPGKVVSVAKGRATVEYSEKIRRTASTPVLVPKKGDYVLVQAGMVVQKVSPKEAKEAIAAWKKLEKT
ncbi:MAG: HypC/HybG/HupF family hydrogenase formation chaperone [Candidatus Micrarchaeia archaeon]|jgi:hydrogenase expression/formation protein HypC